MLLFLLAPWLGAGSALADSPPPEERLIQERLIQERLIQALRQGAVVVLLRHSATVPGAGDPPGFKLEDCATQRNLSDAGREQARRIGRWFETHGIQPATVRSSPWCRARDTAMLAFGRSEDWTALSNIFGDRRHQQEHSAAVRALIDTAAAGAVHILVSHGVSINAFVDVYLQQGEMVVVRRAASGSGGTAGVQVLGRLMVP